MLTHIRKVNQRAHGKPRTEDKHAFRWMWYLKDEVNKTLQGYSLSLPLASLTERYTLFGNMIDEVKVADVLVLVAISLHERKLDDVYVCFCHTLAILLPVPKDSELLHHLTIAKPSIVAHASRASKAARIERGLPVHAFHFRTTVLTYRFKNTPTPNVPHLVPRESTQWCAPDARGVWLQRRSL